MNQTGPSSAGLGDSAMNCTCAPAPLESIWLEAECATVGDYWVPMDGVEAASGVALTVRPARNRDRKHQLRTISTRKLNSALMLRRPVPIGYTCPSRPTGWPPTPSGTKCTTRPGSICRIHLRIVEGTGRAVYQTDVDKAGPDLNVPLQLWKLPPGVVSDSVDCRRGADEAHADQAVGIPERLPSVYQREGPVETAVCAQPPPPGFAETSSFELLISRTSSAHDPR